MKKLKLMFVLLLGIISVVGCGKSPKEDAEMAEATPLGIMTKIEELLSESYDIPLEDGQLSGYVLTDMKNTEEMFMYEDIFNTEDIESGYILQHLMNVRSELIIVAEAKNAESAKNIQAAYEKVLSNQEETWSHYLEDQYQLVKENKIVTQGNYVLYATSEKVDEIVKLFEETVK
ncbi:MAG: DUF4358 domain-containing protein [Turicibacter sp.]|nr:DUF4358 domain-containing protein [Turicibacter sp.]